MEGEEGGGIIVNVPCYPLQMLLTSAGNNDLIVDYFSLDTEGSEASILQSIDFNKITFGVLIIEHNNEEGRIDSFRNILFSHGYIEHKNFKSGLQLQDIVFVNPKYFEKKNIIYKNNVEC
jgi:hypothetical protein